MKPISNSTLWHPKRQGGKNVINEKMLKWGWLWRDEGKEWYRTALPQDDKSGVWREHYQNDNTPIPNIYQNQIKVKCRIMRYAGVGENVSGKCG